MSLNFNEFVSRCREHGLEAVCHGHGHWQILGGRQIVNFYPETKRGPRVYVDGRKHGQRGDMAVAIRFARSQSETGRNPQNSIEARLAALEAENAELRDAIMELSVREFVA